MSNNFKANMSAQFEQKLLFATNIDTANLNDNEGDQEIKQPEMRRTVTTMSSLKVPKLRKIGSLNALLK